MPPRPPAAAEPAQSIQALARLRILRLTLLAPEIVEAILEGRQPAELQLDDLLDGLPREWAQQNEPLVDTGSHRQE